MRSSPEDAKRFFSLLARPGDVFELRALARVNGQQHTTSGYFDDVDALARAAVEISGKHDGIYVTINPVNPALLFRAPKNALRRAGGGETTSDRDVRTRRSILIDVDPARPAGISSSEEEHAAAIERARAIRAALTARGWPPPILADSGNGAHLIYAVDLPVADGGLVQRVLAQLSKNFSTPTLKIDEKNFNPARISKIYGTLTRKGINAPERPHRVATIIEAPGRLIEVPCELLEVFAPLTSSTSLPASRNGQQTFDLDAWIAERLPDAILQPWSEGRKWLLPTCPFNGEHDRKEAFITQKHSGSIAAGCQHDSCFKSWRELREYLEPQYAERKNGTAHADRRASDRPPEVVYQDADYAEMEAFASRDRESTTPAAAARVPWKRLPSLVDEIWSRKDEPWIPLKLAEETLVRIRPGGMAVTMGGSGSGKSSLVANLLMAHALWSGPAIPMSIELPADELGARIVGIRNDAGWEDALTGAVRYEFMVDALAIPRMFVLERDDATLVNLERCIDAARLEYPGEPILVAIDYAQIMDSNEREVRMRVADVFKRIDRVLRNKRVVGIVVSQMGRAGAEAASSGDKIGAETTSLGAESAAIERFATVTITIGSKGEIREDGSESVEVSIGKARMGQGDRVVPMSFWGRTGRWRVSGESKSASEVRNERDAKRDAERAAGIRNLLVGAAHRSAAPLSREQLQRLITKGNKKERTAIIEELLVTGELVEVDRRAPRSRAFCVWTPDRVNATPGMQTRAAMQEDESD